MKILNRIGKNSGKAGVTMVIVGFVIFLSQLPQQTPIMFIGFITTFGGMMFYLTSRVNKSSA